MARINYESSAEFERHTAALDYLKRTRPSLGARWGALRVTRDTVTILLQSLFEQRDYWMSRCRTLSQQADRQEQERWELVNRVKSLESELQYYVDRPDDALMTRKGGLR
jgi:uncharacterized coiled-coil DUF342 family protein